MFSEVKLSKAPHLRESLPECLLVDLSELTQCPVQSLLMSELSLERSTLRALPPSFAFLTQVKALTSIFVKALGYEAMSLRLLEEVENSCL